MPASYVTRRETLLPQMANEGAIEQNINSSTAITKTGAMKSPIVVNSNNIYDESPSNILESANNANNTNSNSTSAPALHGRDRKGTSYVWNYCEKLSRHTVRCRLCTKIMSFHGTANIITHLQRRHNILGDNIGQSSFPLARRGNRSDGIDVNSETVVDGGSGVGAFDPMMITDLIEDVAGENERLNADKYGTASSGNRKSINSASVVWRYCRRISQDQVRCCFCKKNLSYQGTSNLQRHLHRMHGVVTQGRLPKVSAAKANCRSSNGIAGVHGLDEMAPHHHYPVIKEENIKLPNNLDFIWQFCTQHNLLPTVKCNMCEMSFMVKDMLAIAKHLTMIHGVEVNHLVESNNHPHETTGLMSPSKWTHRNTNDFENSDDGNYDYSGLNKWNKIVNEKSDGTTATNSQQQQPRNPNIFGDSGMKKDDSLFYDELLEEERDDQCNQLNRYDEEPFDSNILENLAEINPLSTRSSFRSHSPNDSDRMHHTPNIFPSRLPFSHLSVASDRHLLKLQKNCLRMETEYFREKAGYFRMQKYLTALQAKKLRLELDRLNQSTTVANHRSPATNIFNAT